MQVAQSILSQLNVWDLSHVFAALLMVMGVGFGLRRALNRVFGSKQQKPLFPSVAERSEQLVGAQKCSTSEQVVFMQRMAENGDLNWDLSYDYYPSGAPLGAPGGAPQAQGAPMPTAYAQVPQIPHSASAPMSHAPVRRVPSGAPFAAQRAAPYFRQTAQKPQPEVQIMPQNYYQWDEPYEWDQVQVPQGPHLHAAHAPFNPQMQLNLVPVLDEPQGAPDGVPHGVPQGVPQDVQRARQGAHGVPQPQFDHVPVPQVPHGVSLPQAPLMPDLYEPLEPLGLDYNIVNDVLDVVYDDRAAYAQLPPSTVSPLDPVSYSSSSDHSSSDHESYLSPPYNYGPAPTQSPTHGSMSPSHSSPSHGSPTHSSHSLSLSASTTPEEESSTLSDTPSLSETGAERFVCPHCKAGFRIKGYLTRHLKKHARQKAYTCPFYHPEGSQKCHPTGGFSRRDTYKTHLKARHFNYPQNTPCSERSHVSGTCSGCNQEFASNEQWVETHIQTKSCRGLE